MEYWDRAGKVVGLWVDKRHRVCDKCGREFLSGTFRIARGRAYEALCHTCDPETPHA